jgi:pimeloyl-ACP methyl ester carboxylesterase
MMPVVINPLDGVSIRYSVEGAGTPLVLLHGEMSSLESWHALGYAQQLRERYRVIAIDARGHGMSDKPRLPAEYALLRLTGDVLSVLNFEEIASAHVIGYSLGARTALSLAAHAPERVRSLVLAGGSVQTALGAFDRLTYPGALSIISTQGMDTFLASWSAWLESPLPPAFAALRANDHRAISACLTQIEQETSLVGDLSKIRQPTLLIVGENDSDRLHDAQNAVRQMLDARLVVLPGTDHAGTLMRRDIIMPELLSFLCSVALPSAPLWLSGRS